jgi:hypothetical protein
VTAALVPDVAPPDAPAPTVARSEVDPTRSVHRWLLATALVLGAIVRLVPVATHDFPLNDGGLFYEMALEIRQAGFALPTVTQYNADGIPFAYAPLGFYLAALLGGSPQGILEAVRWIPALVACAMLPVFVLLARALLPNPRSVVAATFAFALVPRSFLWLIMGGGLTRSLGMLFTMAALWQAHALYTRRDWRLVLTTALCAALAVLSHLGTAPFLVVSIGLVWLAYGRHRHGVLASITVGAMVLALTAPWWATVVASHGLAPFQAAQATGGSFLSGSDARWVVRLTVAKLGLGSTAEPLFPMILALGVIGVLRELSWGRLLLPAWWGIIFFADVRAPGTYASIPIAMLAGIAVTEVLLPVLRDWRPARVPASLTHAHSWLTPTRWAAIVLVALAGYGTVGALLRTPSVRSELDALTSLEPADREAMAWVASSTPRDAGVLVVTGANWPTDRIAEWFPVLAARRSVATVQGSEWLPNAEYERRYANYETLATCAARDVACVEQWASRTNTAFSHLYIPKTPGASGTPGDACCAPLIASASADQRYRRVYDGPGASVFERR